MPDPLAIEEILLASARRAGERLIVDAMTLNATVELLRHYRARESYLKAVAGELREEVRRLRKREP